MYSSRFEVFNGHKSLMYLFNERKLNMRQRRWLEYLKDLSYHTDKANMVADALSRKSLHMSTLMVIKMDLIEKFRDLSLVYEITPRSVKGMLKLTNSVLEGIKKG